MNPAAATSGRRYRKRWFQRLQRWNFTLGTIAFLVALTLCLIGALADINFAALQKEQRVRESELKGQLAQFLLSIREPDGSSLLENPQEFSAGSRPLNVVTLRRSFFTYLLQTGNAKVFKTGDISFEAPRACQVEYQGVRKDGTSSGSLRTCFAAVLADQSGRYVYFSLRYPSSKIERHRPGRPLAEVNRVVFTFSGQKQGRLTLSYQIPPLAKSKYPSQLARFDQVHELAGFYAGEGGQPSRLVSGQAFESLVEEDGSAARNYVTVVGRLDAALFQVPSSDEQWPTSALKKVNIGVEVYDKAGPDGKAEALFQVSAGQVGTPLVSLTQAYLAAIPSRASLQVRATGAGGNRSVVWRSDDDSVSQSTTRLDGRWQWLADKWTELIISKAFLQSSPMVESQNLRIGGVANATATLTSTPFMLPDLATRAFTWISGALFLILGMTFYWGHNNWQLRRIRKTAYAVVVKRTGEEHLKQFAARDELGTLARVFYLVLRRSRSRDSNLVKRLREEQAMRAEKLRLQEGHLQNRKSILDAIGHEIRSPLQSLLNITKELPAVQQQLGRIRRAVTALFTANSVEEGLRSGEIALSPHDLADWLSRYARNLDEAGRKVKYVGPIDEIIVQMDSMQLEQILDSLLDNAERYRIPGSDIELRLQQGAFSVELAVFNQGPAIPEAGIEQIFDLGVSDGHSGVNSGLGLFASRIYALAMEATLSARNEPTGVSFALQFPWRASK
ncbi:sensor histidine kinase [Paucibacter sp. Y2R2-4]|uniref:sensor histidine kinase n=1 Tax=Paucibacter sp. Y2R2-4 TaxID=2893553 RepID=UPI0021E43657|nr:HAMP domain-containing sensor histidine kinase [Paucibacter sp. Y2R2-4]MCV2350804.1 HAMP domain-containing histidine kinase [Paucibacter sp. Y2R2-4]